MAKGVLNLFNVLLPFIITPYVYRVLGAHNMGNIDYATVLFGYFGMLGMSGIYNYGLREISAHRNNRKVVTDTYKNLFCIGLITNLLFLAIYILFILFFIHDPELKRISYILCGNLVSQIIYVEWYNEAMEEFKFITVKTVLIRLISFIFIFTLVRNESDEYIYVMITVAVAVLNYLVSYIYSRKKISISWRDLFSGIHPCKYIIPLLTILVLNNTGYLYTVFDRTLLGYYTGTENVAYFSLGQKIVELCKLVILSIVFATLPRLSLYLNENPDMYQQTVKRIMKLTLSLMIPVSIGLFMLARPIILLFGGDEYLPAVAPMRIFALRIIVLGIDAILYNQIIFLHGKEKILVLFNLLCGAVNIILNVIFIGNLTPAVSISCTLISEIIFVCICLIYIYRNIKIKVGLFNLTCLRYFGLSLLFIPVIYGIGMLRFGYQLQLALSIATCSIIYISSLFFLKDQNALDLVTMIKKFLHLNHDRQRN